MDKLDIQFVGLSKILKWVVSYTSLLSYQSTWFYCYYFICTYIHLDILVMESGFVIFSYYSGYAISLGTGWHVILARSAQMSQNRWLGKGFWHPVPWGSIYQGVRGEEGEVWEGKQHWVKRKRHKGLERLFQCFFFDPIDMTSWG